MYDPFPSSNNLTNMYGNHKPQPARDYSNNVLISTDMQGTEYFLPLYLRIMFLEVEDVNIRQLTAQLYATLMITIYYKNLPNYLMEQLNHIEFTVRSVEVFVLSGQGDNRNSVIVNNVESHTMEYLHRGKFPLRVESDVLMAPFQMIDFKLFLTFRSKTIFKNDKSSIIKFNCMDISNTETKCSILYTDSNVSGSYGLAESSLRVNFSGIRSKTVRDQRNNIIKQLSVQLQESHNRLELQTYKTDGGLIHKGRIQNWRFVRFEFKMYRYPINTIVIIFYPLWILSFVNLVIFYADPNDVSGKLQTISGLMIAYAALLPTIRDKIPPSPQITLMEYLIYSLFFTTFISALDTLIARQRHFGDDNYRFTWYRSWTFLLSIFITISTIVIILFVSILYKCVWEPRYNFTMNKRFGAEYQDFVVDTEAWSNPMASQYLRDKTTLLKPDTQSRNIKQIINQKKGRSTDQYNLPVGQTKKILQEQANPSKFKLAQQLRNEHRNMQHRNNLGMTRPVVPEMTSSNVNYNYSRNVFTSTNQPNESPYLSNARQLSPGLARQQPQYQPQPQPQTQYKKQTPPPVTNSQMKNSGSIMYPRLSPRFAAGDQALQGTGVSVDKNKFKGQQNRNVRPN